MLREIARVVWVLGLTVSTGLSGAIARADSTSVRGAIDLGSLSYRVAGVAVTPRVVRLENNDRLRGIELNELAVGEARQGETLNCLERQTTALKTVFPKILPILGELDIKQVHLLVQHSARRDVDSCLGQVSYANSERIATLEEVNRLMNSPTEDSHIRCGDRSSDIRYTSERKAFGGAANDAVFFVLAAQGHSRSEEQGARATSTSDGLGCKITSPQEVLDHLRRIAERKKLTDAERERIVKALKALSEAGHSDERPAALGSRAVATKRSPKAVPRETAAEGKTDSPRAGSPR